MPNKPKKGKLGFLNDLFNIQLRGTGATLATLDICALVGII